MSNTIAEDLLASGDPTGALKALQAQVRSHAADVKLRIFLVQLLCVLGQWKRALDQLKVCGELDAGTLAMVTTCTAAVQCEMVREAVFAGRTLPHVFGPPAAWVAQLAQALQLDAQGQTAAAGAQREQALADAPGSPGTATLDNGSAHAFGWLADADSRLGPVLEVIVNGRYGWLPLVHCAVLALEPVVDLRDLVWATAQITFVGGAQTLALLPVRYAGTPLADDGLAALARRTEWLEMGGGDGGRPGLPGGSHCHFRGIGQRVLTTGSTDANHSTDSPEFGLLELRQLRFDQPA